MGFVLELPVAPMVPNMATVIPGPRADAGNVSILRSAATFEPP
jgi:hypothetical protein